MHEILSDKKVIFFDVGYTIDYPASGDWLFTNKFNEIVGERLSQCSPELIQQAQTAGIQYLGNNHNICDEIAANPASDVETHYLKIHSLAELIK